MGRQMGSQTLTKREESRTADNDIAGESIVFGSSPNAASTPACSTSHASEFGEDPVRRARTQGSVDRSGSGSDMQMIIVEESPV